MSLHVLKCPRPEAQAFIHSIHRHHSPKISDFFNLACADEEGVVRGVCTVGRPTSRWLQDGWTAEVNRLATDGTKNACSFLYGAAAKTAKAFGFRMIVTYTLVSESGSSLRAVGWERVEIKKNDGKYWKSRQSREGFDLPKRVRWDKRLGPEPPFQSLTWPLPQKSAQTLDLFGSSDG